MEEVKRALARTNLTQTALLTLPWTLLQVGGFWAAADARAGLTGAIVVGVMSVGALVALAVQKLLFRRRPAACGSSTARLFRRIY